MAEDIPEDQVSPPIEEQSPPVNQEREQPSGPGSLPVHEDLGESAVNSTGIDSDGTEQIEEASSTLVNEDKAWDMAKAGNSNRTKAARFRQSMHEAEDEGRTDDAEISSLAVKNHENWAQGFESWAGILYDHPVSEAYRQAHQGINFTPTSLRIWEGSATAAKANAKDLEKFMAEAPLTAGITGVVIPGEGFATPSEVILMACGITPEDYEDDKPDWLEPENKDKIEQYLSLIRNPDSTLGQLKDYYSEVFRIAKIDPEREFAQSIDAVLDDVRSGRASE